MAAARAALRLNRLAAAAPRPVFSPIGRPIAVHGTRTFTNSPTKPKSEVIREKEIPVSVYTPDSKGAGSEHFSIPVKANAAPAETPTLPPENDEVLPLAKKVFDSLPPTMQKMTVHDKVIIITG